LNVTIEITIQSLGKSLSHPWTAQVGTLDNKPIRFEDLSLDFYSELLFQQIETVPAELKVRLLEEGTQQLCEVIWSLDFYSPSTWLLTDSTKETLAAFVKLFQFLVKKQKFQPYLDINCRNWFGQWFNRFIRLW
jgi:hypothetical protein